VTNGLIDETQQAAIEAALAAGKIPPQDTKLGGALLVHGGGAGADWTLGCVAMEDADIDELRAALPAGMRTDILILP
jgi:L,D-peptidoglycan transpeptidase YkuD (ErfK/YbiS/YcfS/YnhG family)